jgi:hypothetical protein
VHSNEGNATRCTFCGNDAVDDENHYFFQCQRFAAAGQLFPAVFDRARSFASLLDLFLYDKSHPDSVSNAQRR